MRLSVSQLSLKHQFVCDTTLEAKLETGLAQLQVKLMTWTTVLAGIIIAVLKLT